MIKRKGIRTLPAKCPVCKAKDSWEIVNNTCWVICINCLEDDIGETDND